VATFIYLLIFYLTKNINSPLLKMPENIKQDSGKAERIVSVFHLIIMMILTVITYEGIAVGLEKNDTLSPVTNYLIVVLFLGVIAMMIYSYKISKRNASQNLSN
jgi:SNF family Na+-dependent transporter